MRTKSKTHLDNLKEDVFMQYSKEVEEMVCVQRGPHHGPAPIPEEGKWVLALSLIHIWLKRDGENAGCRKHKRDLHRRLSKITQINRQH